jgi:DNA-directed DNA polymerase III PolC
MAPFAHLHVHSCYSFHDGADTPAALVARAAELGYSALALTDANGLYAAVPFCAACREAGIAPLLGAELDGAAAAGPRAVVLARGLAGYPALCRLVTRRHLECAGEEDQSEPDGGAQRRVLARGRDPGAVHGGAPDLLRLIAAEAGAVVCLVADPALLRALAAHLPRGTLFGELVYDGSAASASRCRATLAACRALSLPFAATNAVRFARPEGFEIHRLLRAIGENGTVWSVPPRAHRRHFLTSPAETAALFAHLPEALDAAARIAAECACPLGFDGWKFPAPHLPAGETAFSLLWQKSFAGLKERYRPLTRAATERLRLELSVIEEKGFSPYFLAVDEIASQARAWGLRMVGRGSAANSLVSHCLGFTHVDPLAHGLFFERFLNPERASPPDIDLDFSWKDRDRLLEWVYGRWGADRVALISTHVTFGPRAAVRETGKAHGLPDAELTRLTRRIPHWGVDDLEQIADGAVPECRSLPGDDPTFARCLALGARVIGHPRHLSIHAGGVVIAPGPLTDLVPLERAAKGFVVTQYDMGPVEALGLIKIDLLSQRSLGVLQDAAAAVAAHTGAAPPVDERETVLRDPETRRLIREGRTMGCFYVESPAMRSLLRKLGTETFEELTAASSVIRPGVAESGMMQEYIRRHHLAREAAAGPAQPWYPDPRLAAVLGETHGVMIYQEDVLRVAHVLAGMSLGQADTLRRSMSGKLRSPEAMAQVRAGFLAGCVANGVARAVAEETWRQVESFAGYAFCKAHSASYALLSFQVAYLKAHHPAEFMAAVISNQGGFYDTAAYLSEARRMGLALLLPDVNRSEREYTGRGREIRMGLMAFPGLAESAVEGLLSARRAGGPFTNLSDLMGRAGLGRADLELLVRGGACDGFELTRPELLWRLACRGAGRAPRPPGAHAGEDGDLFPGACGLDHLVPRLPEYPLAERCRMEREIFGFPVTRHPLELAPRVPAAGGPALPLVTADRMARFAGRRVRMRGLAISYKRVPVRRTGAWMKFLSCEDLTGTFEATLFPAAYGRYAELALGPGPFLLEGRVELDHGVPSLTVDRLAALAAP